MVTDGGCKCGINCPVNEEICAAQGLAYSRKRCACFCPNDDFPNPDDGPHPPFGAPDDVKEAVEVEFSKDVTLDEIKSASLVDKIATGSS